MTACVEIRREVEAHGVALVQPADLTEARELLTLMGAHNSDTESNGPYATRWLDPHRSPVSSVNSFWYFLLDKRGHPVGKIGARCDDIGAEGYRKFARRALAALYPEDRVLCLASRFPDVADTFTGQITYCGDLHLPHYLRGKKLGSLLTDLVYLNMQIRWGLIRPIDYLVTYIRQRDQGRGWIQSPWRVEPETASFSHPPSTIGTPSQMIWCDRAGFLEVIRRAQSLRRSTARDHPAAIAQAGDLP